MAENIVDDVPWLEEVRSPPEHPPDDAPRLRPLLVDSSGDTIDTLQKWQARRIEIRRWWEGFLSPLSSLPERVPPVEVLEEECLGDVTRQRVRYEVEPGVLTQAYLLIPTTQRVPTAGVVVLHSTVDESIDEPSGIAGATPKSLGLDLARRGFVALCPRNFLWRNNHMLTARWQTLKHRLRRPRCKGMAKMLQDAVVAVNVLASLPEVDPGRLGAVGHSLGAKQVLYLAAFDERIQVAASSEGGIGVGFSNWDAPWYLGRRIRHRTFNHEHHELLAMVAPRAFLLVGGDGFDGARSWPFIEAVLPVYGLHGVPSRVGLYNHRQGHKFPPQAAKRIHEWLEAYC